MPIKLNLTPVPSKAELVAKKQKVKAEKKEKKESTKRRKYIETNAVLYGTQLFEPVKNREKSVIITFPERFTNDRTRISTCGKFAFRPQSDCYYELFYLLEPILEYGDDLELAPNEKVILFDLLTGEELKALAISLMRMEFQEEKDKLLAQLIEDEKQIRLDKDKKEEEEEREEEEKLKAEELANEQTNKNEQVAGHEGEISEKRKIESEGKKEERLEQIQESSQNLPTGFFFRSAK